MTKEQFKRYSFAFHEAGHVVVANRLGVPYAKAEIIGDGTTVGGCHLDYEAINKLLAEKAGAHDFAVGMLHNVIFLLKGGETVDREILRLAEADVLGRASGDVKILEETIRPIYVENLKLPEHQFREVVAHGERACKQVITTAHAPLMIAQLAEVI